MLTPQLEFLIGLFILFVVVWFILIIYKRRLERAEEGVLLGVTPERLNPEQAAVLDKVNRLSKPMWIIGTLTVLALLATIAMWIYQGLLIH